MTLTGNQYEISAGPYRAVVTEGGAGLRELTCEGRPLILSHGADEVPPAGYGQQLMPWPNRIDHGRYEHSGETQQLDVSEPAFDCAIHGLVRWEPWVLDVHSGAGVRLTHRLLGRKGYPFRLDLAVEYLLDSDGGLTVRWEAANPGTAGAPFGYGAHPYLTVGAPIDVCTVGLPAALYQPTDERMIPDGPPVSVAGTPYDLREPRVLGAQQIDNAYTGLSREADGRVWVRLSAGDRTTAFWADGAHPWLEVYTADKAPQVRAGLAVEPMTCPPDAFNSGIDVIDIKPGDTTGGSWGIIAR